MSFRSRLAVVPIGLGLFAVQLFLERFPYGRVAEWLLAAMLGIAAAVVFFWKDRTRRWFWWSVAAIAGVQTVLIVLQGPYGLPEHLGKGFMAIVGADAAVTSFLFYWASWLFEPREAPQTAASKAIGIVSFGFVILFIAIFGFVYWAMKRA
jgi:hypothetical protein